MSRVSPNLSVSPTKGPDCMFISETEEERIPTEAPYLNNGDYRCHHSNRECPTPLSGHLKPNLTTNNRVNTNSFRHRLGSTRATAGSNDEGSPSTSIRIAEPTPAPSLAPSSDSTPLEWDTKALPQHDKIISNSQPNHTTETPHATELPHQVLESIQNHKL